MRLSKNSLPSLRIKHFSNYVSAHSGWCPCGMVSIRYCAFRDGVHSGNCSDTSTVIWKRSSSPDKKQPRYLLHAVRYKLHFKITQYLLWNSYPGVQYMSNNASVTVNALQWHSFRGPRCIIYHVSISIITSWPNWSL